MNLRRKFISCYFTYVYVASENQALEREYDVDIENCPPQELDKALHKFYVEVCNFVMLIINKQLCDVVRTIRD